MLRPSTRDARFIIRKYFLVVSDLFLLTSSLLLYIKYFYIYDLWPRKTLTENPGWYILLLLVWLLYSNAFKLYSTINAPRTAVLIGKTSLVAIATAATYMMIPFLSPNFPTTRLPFFVFIGLVVVLMTLWHWIFSALFRHPMLSKRVLIVGAGWSGQEIAKVLQTKQVFHNNGYRVLGYIDDDPEKKNLLYNGIRVLSNNEDLFKYARRLAIDEVVLAAHTAKSVRGPLYGHLVNCESYGIPITPVNMIYEAVTGKLLVKQKGDNHILTYEYYSKKKDMLYLMVNRALNLVFGLIGVFGLLVLIPLVWFVNLFVSRGPLFYSQIRVGRDNQPFTIYKIRTMIVDAEKNTGAVWAGDNDPRITLAGKFYRKTRIDELPQFWNVLKGDMNLIGPRPERPIFCNELDKKISFFNTRHLVKPGITGWAQVRHKYGNTDEDALIKLQYDLYYIKYRSFMLDLSIIWQTISVMLKFKGN